MRHSSGFVERIKRHADRDPDRAAIVSLDVAISYRELVGRVDACARALAAQGLGAGEIVGLTVGDEALHLVATLALLELGIPQVSLGTHDPMPMRARLAARVGVARIVAASHDDRLDDLLFATVGSAGGGHPSRPAPFHDEPVVYFTGSGTTGEPKVVRMSERQIALQADRGYTDYGPERVLRLASVEHNNSKRLRLHCLWQGGTCVLRGAEPVALSTLCERFAVSWLDVAAYHLEDFVRSASPAHRFPAHTRLRCGGSRVPHRLRQEVLANVSAELHVSYGTTELGGVCIAYPHEHADPREPVGQPLAGVEVEIVDTERRPVASGEVGEIRLRAPGMVTGYVGDPEATKRHFVDGWFYPGDLVCRLPGGALCISGRVDDMMILNGINIFPAEVERVLESMPGVQQAKCFALRSDMHGEIPVAVVEVSGAEGPRADAIAQWARGWLGVRAPRRIVVVDALPRNAQGKVARRDLAALVPPMAGA
ncbi:MAG: class I adenylate-forming enzyme family protein [Betaproteobacteria bacterium]